MFRKLGSRCKTGKELYELDPKDINCTYQMCVKGRRCPMFSPASKKIKRKHNDR